MTPRGLQKANVIVMSILVVATGFNAMIWFGSRGPVARFKAAAAVVTSRHDRVTSQRNQADSHRTQADSQRDTVGPLAKEAQAAPRQTSPTDPVDLAARLENLAPSFGAAVRSFVWAGGESSRNWRGGPDFVVNLEGPEDGVMNLVAEIEFGFPGLCLTAVRAVEGAGPMTEISAAFVVADGTGDTRSGRH